MTPLLAGGLMFACMIGLLALGMPVAVTLLLVGSAGYVLQAGWGPFLGFVSFAPLDTASLYSLTVIPLFLLMGQFAAQSGLSRLLFDAASAWIGHRRGGLAMAGVGASALFGCICGSSLATAATMGQVALPEMRRHGYAGSLATGALAAGGTLGILIPPSVVLVIYAVLTDQSVGKLFVAAVIPGVLATLGYVAAIALYVRARPEAGPSGPRRGWPERLRALLEIWPVAAVFVLIVAGINLGWFTPTEGAAVGAAATGLAAALRRRLGWAGLRDSLLEVAKLTGMIYLIFIGAEIFNAALAMTLFPLEASQAIAGAGWPPLLVVAAMLLVYLLLGCVMDSIAMILLTMPVFFPIVTALDFGLTYEETAIWFGILALMVVEIGLITPPVGMNVFVINGLARDVPITQSFRGVLPFLASDAVRVLLLLFVPTVALAGVWATS